MYDFIDQCIFNNFIHTFLPFLAGDVQHISYIGHHMLEVVKNVSVFYPYMCVLNHILLKLSILCLCFGLCLSKFYFSFQRKPSLYSLL
jgi:hypothetical protein